MVDKDVMLLVFGQGVVEEVELEQLVEVHHLNLRLHQLQVQERVVLV
jgi:hypothetical protein